MEDPIVWFVRNGKSLSWRLALIVLVSPSHSESSAAEASLVMSKAAIALESGVAAMGGNLRTVTLTVGDDIVVSSVAPGPSMPVLVVRPNGSVVYGVATIDVQGPRFTVTNVRCR